MKQYATYHSPVNPVCSLQSFACKTCQGVHDKKHHISFVPTEALAFEIRSAIHQTGILGSSKVNIISPHTQTLQKLSGIPHHFANVVS